MPDPVPLLADLVDHAWGQIVNGVRDRHHGFHTPTICTVDATGAPSGRVVVLRGASPSDRQLVFHTDRRSTKLQQLEHGITWVLYDATQKLQVRAFGHSRLADDGVTDARWTSTSVPSRKCYLVTDAPGTPAGTEWTSGMPDDLPNADLPTPDRSESGRAHFAVVQTTVTQLETLFLSRFGHQRARFTWQDGRWEGTWLVP